MTDKIRIGISSCLLGNKVRYDGRHKLDIFIVSALDEHADFVSICPEADCGLPVPHEPMRLVGNPDSPCLTTIETGDDHTEQICGWIDKRIAELKGDGIRGFILKSRSPSCGIGGVAVYSEDGEQTGSCAGLFADAVGKHFPGIPINDETQLQSAESCTAFMEQAEHATGSSNR